MICCAVECSVVGVPHTIDSPLPLSPRRLQSADPDITIASCGVPPFFSAAIRSSSGETFLREDTTSMRRNVLQFASEAKQPMSMQNILCTSAIVLLNEARRQSHSYLSSSTNAVTPSRDARRCVMCSFPNGWCKYTRITYGPPHDAPFDRLSPAKSRTRRSMRRPTAHERHLLNTQTQPRVVSVRRGPHDERKKNWIEKPPGLRVVFEATCMQNVSQKTSQKQKKNHDTARGVKSRQKIQHDCSFNEFCPCCPSCFLATPLLRCFRPTPTHHQTREIVCGHPQQQRPVKQGQGC